jgi:hypothetical protein
MPTELPGDLTNRQLEFLQLKQMAAMGMGELRTERIFELIARGSVFCRQATA